MRFVRIIKVVLIAGLCVLVARWAFGPALGYLGPGLREIANLCLCVVAMVLASLTERELFWAAPPRRRGPTRHPRIPR